MIRYCRFLAPIVVASIAPVSVALAQQLPAASPAIAFVNVNVISMDGERIDPSQTVVVRGDRIAAMGAVGEVAIPERATIVEATNRYLVPGLTDAHVHLATDMPWAPTRPDFGDAPLYLAHGVTTVINLRGSTAQLDWRRRLEAGELVGPNIYTAGEFVNEPRVNTPEEVRKEIVAQVDDRYDVIKFHEVWVPRQGEVTTTGLPLATYRQMLTTARELGVPLVGHAPVNLGLDALLEARQPLAHIGALSNIYFMPFAGNQATLLVTAGVTLTLIIIVLGWGMAVVAGGWRHRTSPPRPVLLSRVRRLTAIVLVSGLLALACAGLILPGGLLFDSLALRVIFTVLGLLVAAATVGVLICTIGLWRESATPTSARLQSSTVTAAALGLTLVLLTFWVPVAWRSSDSGMRRLAHRLHDAGISVQTTLIVYEGLNSASRSQLMADPATAYLRSETQSRWRQQRFPAALELLAGRYPEFTKRVAGTLHQAGVPLVAGTDTMGVPLVAPGSSLHRELQLLTESGLTTYEAIRTATVNPAVFLGKNEEFGTIAVGKRADLLLIEANPLADLTRLRRPLGVMVRGRWFARGRLDQMLDVLRRAG